MDFSKTNPEAAEAVETPDEILERDINRWLKKELSYTGGSKHNLKFLRYVSAELEDDNMVKFVIMSQIYIRMYIIAELSDLWHDHRTSTVMFNIKSFKMLEFSLLPHFISQRLGYIFFGLIGFIFNPITLRPGVLLRFYSNAMRIDFHDYLKICSYAPLGKTMRDEDGKPNYDYFILGAGSEQGILKPKVYPLSPKGRERTKLIEDEPPRPERKRLFRASDVWQLSMVAAIVSVSCIVLRPYFAEYFTGVSFSWSFLSSLLFLGVSLVFLNLARWIYQIHLKLKKDYRSIEFRAEETSYQIYRLKRDIGLEMKQLINKGEMASLEKYLFKAGRHRERALRMEERLEIMHREIKIKYGLAYLVTLLSEFIAYNFF